MILIKGTSKADKAWVERIKQRVISLEYEQIDGGHDKFKLVIDNSDRSLLSADEVGISIKTVVVQWGRIGTLTRARKINFNKVKGFKKLIYEGTGGFFRYDQERKNKLWKGMSHLNIVKDIASNMGFGSPDVEDPKVRNPLVKQFETDMQFLMRLAKDVGYACWLDEDGLHWKTRDASKAPSLKIVYGGGDTESDEYGFIIGEPIVEFGYSRATPKKSTGVARARVAKIQSANGGVVKNQFGTFYINKKGKVTQKQEAGDDTSSAKKETYAEGKQATVFSSNKDYCPTTKEGTVFSSNKDYCPLEKKGVIFSSNEEYCAEGATHKIVGQQRRMSKKKVKVSMTIVGKSNLSKGKTVELIDFAELVDGKYYIKKMTDNVSGEYFTQKIELRRGSSPAKTKGNRVKGKFNKKDFSNPNSKAYKKGKEVLFKKFTGLLGKAWRRGVGL